MYFKIFDKDNIYYSIWWQFWGEGGVNNALDAQNDIP